jgi:hypothetical protein
MRTEMNSSIFSTSGIAIGVIRRNRKLDDVISIYAVPRIIFLFPKEHLTAINADLRANERL